MCCPILFMEIGHGDWAKELPGHRDAVTCLAFSSDGKLLASGGFDGLIQVWDITSGSLKCTLEGPGGGIEWVRWHPRGYVVLVVRRGFHGMDVEW
ncbi:hypothetical protein IFM89_032040 [Coptis chinensis]|uniref:Uncharacterized protein n=1 Tax=Coptis chinensis TaxID=261450 RepID=A0A835H270_9MAGN|nr:hypothetical protein IFM89_032040 [Coptis chinensis]